MAGQYETFRSFDLGSGFNLKHDPALVGPAFAQTADNVDVDEDTVRAGHGIERLNDDLISGGALSLGDVNIHYGDQFGLGENWDNFEFLGQCEYAANTSHTTDAASPVIPSALENRYNAPPETRHLVIPYTGVSQSRTLAQGYTLRLGAKLPSTFSMEAMRAGQAFPIYQVGGDPTDRFCAFLFGYQLVTPWEGYPTDGDSPSGVQRGAAMLVPFVLFNDASTKSGGLRKLMWDVAVEPGMEYMWAFRLDDSEGVKLFKDGEECDYFGASNNFDQGDKNFQLCSSPSDDAVSYGIGEADRASFVMRGGPYENNTEAYSGTESALTAISGSTTTNLIVSGLDNTVQHAGWFIFCRTGTNRNVGQFRWVASSTANSSNTALTIDQAWDATPSAGDTFECYPAVWTRKERASDDAAYVAWAHVSDVHVWLKAKTDAEIAAMGARPLTKREIEKESNLMFYYRGDRATAGTVEDEGPTKTHAFFSGTPANDGDGIFLDGCRSSLRTRWGDNAPTENKTIGKLMQKLLRGNGVTTTASSNKQFAFRQDFTFWNKHADVGHYVLAQQGTSDTTYRTSHITSNAADQDHLSTTDDAWIWQLSCAAGSYTPYTSGLGEQNIHLHWRHCDPTNSSDGGSTLIREYDVTLDLNAAGFDISGKTVSISWGLISPHTSYVTAPSANGRLWLRLYHEGELIAQATDAVSHTTAPNGDDLLETPYDELSLGRALMPTTTVGVSLKRFGPGHSYSPIKVHGCWVLPGSDSYGQSFRDGVITPGQGRKNRFFGDLGNAGSLVDITDGSATVTSHHGDDFNENDGWGNGTYGLTTRFLYLESVKGETASKRFGREEFWPLIEIIAVSGSSLTLDSPIMGYTASGVPASTLMIAFGCRFSETEEADARSRVPSAEKGLEGFEFIPAVGRDEGPFSQHWDFVTRSTTDYVEDGPAAVGQGQGVFGTNQSEVSALVEYENPKKGTTQVVAAVGGSVGVLDNGWRRGSLFLDQDVDGKSGATQYSFEFGRSPAKAAPLGIQGANYEGLPNHLFGYARTPLSMTQDFTFEFDVRLKDISGKRTVYEITYGEDSGATLEAEENEAGYYLRVFIEEGVPKVALHGANGGSEVILRPASSRGLIRPRKWFMVSFVHGSTINDTYFYINGKQFQAEVQSGTFASSVTPQTSSYVSDTGYHFGVLGASKPLGRPFADALGGQLSRLAAWNSEKRTGEFDPVSVLGESTTGAAMYLTFSEGRGRSLEDSEGGAHMDIRGSSYQPFFHGKWPEEGFSLKPFGGNLHFGHKGIPPQVWDGEVVLPSALEAPTQAPVIELVTESISFDDGAKAVSNGLAGGEFGWLNNAQNTTYGYKLEENSDACGLLVPWTNAGFQFGGNHWLESEPDNKFSLGKFSDKGWIVLQGFIYPQTGLDTNDRMIVMDARVGERDGWALETVGRKLRFSYWDDNNGKARFIETRKEVLNEGNWHYFYFRWKVGRGSADWTQPTGAWSDIGNYDAFVCFDITQSWTYESSLGDDDLIFGDSGNEIYAAGGNTADDFVSLRVGGNPLTNDAFSGVTNFIGAMDTIQGQLQASQTDIKIKRLFVDSDWANNNTDASGNWTPAADSFPDIARPDLAQNDDIYAWSLEELEAGKGYAVSRVNIGSGTAGSCDALTQEGSFLDWRWNVASTNNTPNAAGSHQFAVTLYDPVLDMESPPSPIATSLSPEGSNEGEATLARWRVSNLPTFPSAGRVWRRIYKTTANQQTLYLAHEIKDTNTSQVDIAPGETFLVNQWPLRLDVFMPPRAGLIDASENSMFYSRVEGSPETVVYSEPFYPWRIVSGNTTLSESGDGTEVTALYFFRGAMSAFTKKSVYMTTLREFGYAMDRMNSVAGAAGAGAVATDGEEILLLGSRGFYRGGSAATIRYEGWTLEDFFKNEFDFQRGHMTRAVFDRSNGVVFFLCPTKGDHQPYVILRGYKNDHSMGIATTADTARQARYAWTKLTGAGATALAEVTDVNGDSRVLVGNQFGMVGYLEKDEKVMVNDAVGYSDFKQTDTELTITDITDNVVTVSETLVTRDAGLTGATLVVGTETARVESNTANTLTVDVDGLSGSTGYLGSVRRIWHSGWLDFSTFEKRKRNHFLDLQFDSTSTNTVTVKVFEDFSTTASLTFAESLSTSKNLELRIGSIKARYLAFEISYDKADADFNLLKAGVRLHINEGRGHSSDQR